MEDDIKKSFPQAEVKLIPGSGGVYEISLDDKLIFSKKEQTRFPKGGEVVTIIKDMSG